MLLRIYDRQVSVACRCIFSFILLWSLCSHNEEQYQKCKRIIRFEELVGCLLYSLNIFLDKQIILDHGAHLFIGKEKVIRPLACEDSVVINDAEAGFRTTRGNTSATTSPSTALWSSPPMPRCGVNEVRRKALVETNTI